ncbi:MAG: ornithine carbamoyltransferase, partial [Chloroflexota bacterium]|nr:ornithine carbamoyltransferase [Chloroflexota bacterium]
MPLKGRDFLSVGDLTSDELAAVIDLAGRMKAGEQSKPLAGKSVALLFEHPSLRTRTTFEVGIFQLGGQPVTLPQETYQPGQREPLADIARNLERWVHAIVARVRAHATLVELAKWSKVPVINALSNREHPCQVLADMLTVKERLGTFKGSTLLFCGDGNNVCHSLLLVCARLGMNVCVASPPGYWPLDDIVSRAMDDAGRQGSFVRVAEHPEEFLGQADVIYTDVWTSMGQEGEADTRREVFGQRYQVNAELLAKAKPSAFVMHDLPAHRGEEITDE